MKVYYHGRSPQHTLFVQPAVSGHENMPQEWKEVDGKPKLIEVVFIHGVAEVPSNLGHYLIDKGLAAKSKIFLPEKVA